MSDRVWQARQAARRRRVLSMLDRDTLFSVNGSQYRVMRIRDNGEINAWGPIQANMKSPYGSMRTFRWTDIDPKKVYGLWQRPV